MANDLPTLDWSKEDFRAWLEAKDPTSICGYSMVDSSCPLANWRQAMGDGNVAVNGHQMLRCGPTYEVIGWIPDWAMGFVWQVDRLGGGSRLYAPVFVRQAIQILNMQRGK